MSVDKLSSPGKPQRSVLRPSMDGREGKLLAYKESHKLSTDEMIPKLLT